MQNSSTRQVTALPQQLNETWTKSVALDPDADEPLETLSIVVIGEDEDACTCTTHVRTSNWTAVVCRMPLGN